MFKSDALVLRAADHGENGKLVTLFTADRGKLTAALKGVKKAGAKLYFAAQPFCFAEYVFAEKSGRYTVTSASLYDGFYPLRESIEAFYAASAVTEACDGLLYEGMVNGRLFVAAVEALKELCAEPASPALAKFLLIAAREAGYPVTAEQCPVCGRALSGRMAFDMHRGAFTCAGCSDGVPASESTYEAIRAISRGAAAGEEGSRRALRLLRAYLSRQTDLLLPTLGEYDRLFR